MTTTTLKRRLCSDKWAAFRKNTVRLVTRCESTGAFIAVPCTCMAGQCCKLGWGWGRVLQQCEQSLCVAREWGCYTRQGRGQSQREREGEVTKTAHTWQERMNHLISSKLRKELIQAKEEEWKTCWGSERHSEKMGGGLKQHFISTFTKNLT